MKDYLRVRGIIVGRITLTNNDISRDIAGIHLDNVMTAERLRFSMSDHLTILHEVIAINPYKDPKLWKEINRQLLQRREKLFSSIGKGTCDYFLKLWQRKDILIYFLNLFFHI